MAPAERIIFFGTADFSLPSLQALIDGHYDIVAVVTKPDAAVRRSQTPQPPVVKILAESYFIPVLQPTETTTMEKELAKLNPNLGVVVSYGRIIPQSIIDLFPKGLLNIHASLLPRWRGASCIEQAILAGDSETGVTLMQIDAGMDTGPIYATSSCPLLQTETKPELYTALADLGGELLAAKLPGILAGTLLPRAQDDSLATASSLIAKSAGAIDWKLPAAQIERRIRAYLGWPGSRTTLFGRDVIITKAHAVPTNFFEAKPGATEITGEIGILMVQTGNGSICIDRLIPVGKTEMDIANFLRGVKQ